MFKFLFGGKSRTPVVTIETDRTRFARLVSELNEMIDGLPVKPRVTFDPEGGHILPDTPEQFADEALALPAPEAVEPAVKVNADELDAPEPMDADDAMPKQSEPMPPVSNSATLRAPDAT